MEGLQLPEVGRTKAEGRGDVEKAKKQAVGSSMQGEERQSSCIPHFLHRMERRRGGVEGGVVCFWIP